jgi:glycerol-3-phosphate dehydrogenase
MAGAALSLIPAVQSRAGDAHIEPVTAYVEATIRSWIEDPIIVEELKSQNVLHAHLTPAAIAELDATWRTEFASNVHPLIDTVVGNPLSKFLKDKQIASGGVITEIFVIDAKGLSVGESEISSDYWQGDEPKWQKTYLVGPSVLFVDVAEKDESTQMLQSQASLTVSDPQTGQPIGAITIGINLDAL